MSSKALVEAVGRGSDALAQAVVVDRAGVPGRLAVPDRLNLIKSLSAARSHIEWMLLRQLQALAMTYPPCERRPEYEGEKRAKRDWVREEVATALHMSCWDAGRHLRTADVLAGPGGALTSRALRDGLVTINHAHAVARATDGLPEELAVEVDTQLMRATAGQALTPTQLGRRAERLRDELAPEQEAEDDRLTATGREVTIVPPSQGSLAKLVGWLTPEAASMLATALGPLAEPTGDDERTGEQRRHDALLELATRALRRGDILGRDGSPATLQVTVPLQTLLGGTAPGETAGYGLLSAATVRRIGCEACWRALVTSPDDRKALYLGRTHRLPTQTLRRFVRARDASCRFPGCSLGADRCDAHHIRFWAAGGHTDPDNLLLLCQRHHTAVHEAGWRLERAADGGWVWTSPLGARFVTVPPDQPAALAPLRRAARDAARRHVAGVERLRREPVPRPRPAPPAASLVGPGPLRVKAGHAPRAWATFGVPAPWRCEALPTGRQPRRRRRAYHPREESTGPPSQVSGRPESPGWEPEPPF